MAEIEPRLKSLRRQAKRLEQREDLEKELREFQSQYYGYLLQGLNAQLSEVNQKVGIFEKQISELHNEIADLSRGADQQEKQTRQKTETFKKLRADLDALQKDRLKLLEELATVRGKIKAEQGSGKKNVSIDIEKLKTKFQAAYARLINLFNNFDKSEAERVKALFDEVAEAFGDAEQVKDAENALAILKQEEGRLNRELETLFAKIQTLENDFVAYTKEEEEIKQQLFVKERLLRNKQEAVVKTSEAKNQLAVEQAKLATRQEGILEEARSALGREFQPPAEKINISLSETQDKIAKLKKQLDMIGGVDELLLQEYQETEARYTHLSTQSADLEKGVADLKTVIGELDEVIKKEFQEAFTKVSEKFAEYFRLLFSGGKATMTLLREQPLKQPEVTGDEELDEQAIEEENDKPASSAGKLEIVGVDIRATPPGKKLAGISALSGGERALTSIALLSAMLHINPAPFVVLDEVDAALDEANSIRFGKIIGTLAHKTQFITITHNRETMRQSHTLYGVTMGDDSVSKIISLKLEQAAVYSTKN